LVLLITPRYNNYDNSYRFGFKKDLFKILLILKYLRENKDVHKIKGEKNPAL